MKAEVKKLLPENRVVLSTYKINEFIDINFLCNEIRPAIKFWPYSPGKSHYYRQEKSFFVYRCFVCFDIQLIYYIHFSLLNAALNQFINMVDAARSNVRRKLLAMDIEHVINCKLNRSLIICNLLAMTFTFICLFE